MKGERRLACVPVVALREATGSRPPDWGERPPGGILIFHDNHNLYKSASFSQHPLPPQLWKTRLSLGLVSDNKSTHRGDSISFSVPFSLDFT